MKFAMLTESKPGYASFGAVPMIGSKAQADQYAALHAAVEGIAVTILPTNDPSTIQLSAEIASLKAALKSGIVDGIKEAIMFTDDDELEDGEFAVDTEVKIESWVEQFIEANGDRLIPERNADYATSGCIGNDIWYTTQGHGVGFWETDRYTDEVWAQWAYTYCETHALGEVYKGDDNLIYMG